jgi:hypothetical protein
MMATLGFLAMRSEWRGWRLGLATCAILFAIDVVNLAEGVVFLGTFDLRSVYQTTLTDALMIPIMGIIFAKDAEVDRRSSFSFASISVGRKLGRFIVCDFTYLFLYFLAGFVIFPFVRAFYAVHPPPSLAKIVALQLLLRGPVFTAICGFLLRMAGVFPGDRIVVGTTFAILSRGILLLPNPHLPDSIRWIHCVEVGSSHFLFGVLVTYIWGTPSRAAKVLTQKA